MKFKATPTKTRKKEYSISELSLFGGTSSLMGPCAAQEFANAFKKVVKNYAELLESDTGNPEKISGWHFFQQKACK